MNMALIKSHEISYEKRLETCFTKLMVKAIKKLKQMLAGQRMQLSLYANKFFKFRTVKNLPRVGRPQKVKIPRYEMSLLRVLRCSRFEPLKTLCWRAKKASFWNISKKHSKKNH